MFPWCILIPRQEFAGARRLGLRSRHGRRVAEGPEEPVCGGRSSHPLPGGSQQGMNTDQPQNISLIISILSQSSHTSLAFLCFF